jgi:phosphatidyl-myo-inositol dimannoside synthase
MAECSLRVLALVTDAFGGQGGIAQYNQQFLSSLAECAAVEEVIVLPRRSVLSAGELPHRLHQRRPVRGKFAYSIAAFAAARAHSPINVVFCGHILMAPLAAVIAKLMGAHFWVQVHGFDAWQELPWSHRHAIESADLVISVSRYTKRRLLEWVGIDPVRIKVLPNTVNPCFRPGPKPAYLIDRHALQGKKVLMTVSRLTTWDRYKGQDRVIRILTNVLSAHPETAYLVVGDGNDRPRLEALAAELDVPDAVRFLGHVAPGELADYFRLADVFVLPSTGEGFGIVFLEAIACGIPVIGGNRDGSLDPLADGELGTAVDPDDDDELIAAISTALSNPARAMKRADRFNERAFSEHLLALVASNLVAHSAADFDKGDISTPPCAEVGNLDDDSPRITTTTTAAGLERMCEMTREQDRL